MNQFEINQSNNVITSIFCIHTDSKQFENILSKIEINFLMNLKKYNPKNIYCFLGHKKNRLALYVQWNKEQECLAFTESGLISNLCNQLIDLNSKGEFHNYSIPYVNDSEHKQKSIFRTDYKGIFAINEVKTLSKESQKDSSSAELSEAVSVLK